jgi:hypothetical protein
LPSILDDQHPIDAYDPPAKPDVPGVAAVAARVVDGEETRFRGWGNQGPFDTNALSNLIQEAQEVFRLAGGVEIEVDDNVGGIVERPLYSRRRSR